MPGRGLRPLDPDPHARSGSAARSGGAPRVAGGPFGALARGVVRHPWYVIVGWLIAAAAIVAFAPRISSVTNPDQSSFLPSSSESAQAARLAAVAFPAGSGATGVIVVRHADGSAFNDTDLGTVGALAARLNAAKPAAAMGISYDPRQSIAPNRAEALLVVAFNGPAERQDVRDAVAALRHDTTQALAGTGLSAGMTGQAATVVDNQHAFTKAEKIVTLATLALIVVLLALIFRSPLASLLPLVTVGLVYAVSSGLAALGVHLLHRQVGQELPTIFIVVLFGIGTDYILFLLFRYRERLRAGDSPSEAIAAAVERIGKAIGCAALAVVAAFGALVLASLKFFTTLGPALAVGVAVMLLAALTLVPAVVTVLGRYVFWPSRSLSRPVRHRAFAWWGRQVSRRPAIVAVGSLVVLGTLAAGLASLRTSYDPIGQLPGGTEAARAYADLKRGFPAGALNPTDVYLHGSAPIPDSQLAAFVGRLGSIDGVAAAEAPVRSADGTTVRVPLVLSAEPYSAQALDLVSGPLRDQARLAAPSGTSVLIGGATMAFADVRDHTNRDLMVIFPVAGALFMLILAGLLRAAAAPFYLVAMVVTGFAATLGASAWIFGASLAFTIPIILYLFVTAIGTDYNILITARLREEINEGRSPREAAALAIEHAGPSVAAAAAILAGTFAALLISGVPFFVQIGFAVTLGIVLVAFGVSLLFVPAVTALLGRAAWWPGRRRAQSTVITDYTGGNVKAWGGRRLG